MRTVTSQDLNRIIERRSIELSHQRNYRFQNYLDCVDDYSWGGIQDQVADQEMQRLYSLRDKLVKQEENGGFLLETADECCLYREGVLISTKVVNTRYGRCFVFGGGFNPETEDYDQPTFVSIPKKLETLNKKGYDLVVNRYTFKVVYDGTQNSKFDNRTLEVISVEPITPDLSSSSIGYDNKHNTNLWLLKSKSFTDDQV